MAKQWFEQVRGNLLNTAEGEYSEFNCSCGNEYTDQYNDAIEDGVVFPDDLYCYECSGQILRGGKFVAEQEPLAAPAPVDDRPDDYYYDHPYDPNW